MEMVIRESKNNIVRRKFVKNCKTYIRNDYLQFLYLYKNDNL